MFGPMGGSQNIGGGQMSQKEWEMLLGSMQGNSPTGTRLPNYAPAGPAQPQQVPGIGTTGLDRQMLAGAAGGGLDGVNMNAPSNPLGPMEDAIMNFGQSQLEEEKLKRMLAMAGGGMASTLPPGLFSNPIASGGGGFSSVRGGTGPTTIPTGG